MEISPEIIVGIFAIVQLGLVKLSRKTGWSTENIVLVVTLLLGGVYVGIQRYVPEITQQHVLQFASQVFAAQWFIYELYKKFKK